MEQSSMENKLKCINDLLPLELILAILLRIPIKHLARAKCASKLWNTLIADLSFSKCHLDHSLAPTHTYLFIKNSSDAYSINLDPLLLEDNHGVDAIGLTLPFKKQPLFYSYSLLGSCRGLVLLEVEQQFLMLWNPLLNSSKRISCSHIFNAARRVRGRFSYVNLFRILDDTLLYGFGYDASQDDYIVVVAYVGVDGENHFNLCCLGNNLWINLDSVLPKPMKIFDWRSQGLFCNGAIHWYSLVLLGGCLAMYMGQCSFSKTEIWVMKEYNVQSSWTLYEIPLQSFQPLHLSGNGDIIGSSHFSFDRIGFYIYNVSGELVKPVQYGNGVLSCLCPSSSIVFTDSLMPVPNEDKKMKRGAIFLGLVTQKVKELLLPAFESPRCF
ncbi:hypothetical protein PIB30_033817 [Stylosanthes scabra]|uniref:F-box domain-containing protein n=1 Tax=Stylosanthes scabra TaxID=79078 RepID=A0ABU6YD99_9FABA|nr:hypothetical protein [Stylosanthes scabra]